MSSHSNLQAQFGIKKKMQQAKKVEDERLAENAKKFDLLKSKNYPIPTNGEFDSDTDVLELISFVREVSSAKGLSRIKLGELGAGSKSQVDKIFNAKTKFTGYSVPSTFSIGDYNVAGPIYRSRNQSSEEFKDVKLLDDGVSYMNGIGPYWSIDQGHGPSAVLVKAGKGKSYVLKSKDKWGSLKEGSYYYSFMLPDGKIYFENISKKTIKDLEKKQKKNEINSIEEELRKNAPPVILALSKEKVHKESSKKITEIDLYNTRFHHGFVKSINQSFAYIFESRSNSENKNNCFCEASYVPNNLENIINAAKSSDNLSNLDSYPKDIPSDILPKYENHLAYWKAKDVLNSSETTFNSTINCEFSIQGDNYSFRISDANRYPFFEGEISKNNKRAFLISQMIDFKWDGEDYFTPYRGFQITKNDENILALTSALEFTPPEEKKLSAKSGAKAFMKMGSGMLKSGIQGTDLLSNQNIFAEKVSIKKALLMKNSISDDETLPLMIVGSALLNIKPIYGISESGYKAEGLHNSYYIGSSRYNPYAPEFISVENISNLDTENYYEANVFSKYRQTETLFESIDKKDSPLPDNTLYPNPEYSFWRKHITRNAKSIGQNKANLNCKNCYMPITLND